MSSYSIDTVSVLEKIEESALIQLVYVSSLTVRGRLHTKMFKELEAHARKYNKQRGITGILCYGNGQFLQCIEGEKSKILLLQQHINADKRHTNIKVLLIRAIDKRSFFNWRMRLLFLERWLWSPTTKQQAATLSPFLPFLPQRWNTERTEQFLQVIKKFESVPQIRTTNITYNALGSMFRNLVGPHQAFLVVQGVLGLLVVLALTTLLVF